MDMLDVWFYLAYEPSFLCSICLFCYARMVCITHTFDSTVQSTLFGVSDVDF